MDREANASGREARSNGNGTTKEREGSTAQAAEGRLGRQGIELPLPAQRVPFQCWQGSPEAAGDFDFEKAVKAPGCLLLFGLCGECGAPEI